MIDTKKTTQEILQEEFLRERAAVLARAGEHLEAALAVLRQIEGRIDEALAVRRRGKAAKAGGASGSGADDGLSNDRINEMIRAYNDQIGKVRTRHYELIVTREALGLVHHQRLEEIYRIPPKKRCLPEKRPTPGDASSPRR